MTRWWMTGFPRPGLSDADIDAAAGQFSEIRSIHEGFGADLVATITRIVEQDGIEIAQINSRPKKIDEFKRKCRRKRYLDPLHQMFDLTGVRIVLYFDNDARRVSDLIRASFLVNESESEDKHRTNAVDQFGYLSNHLIVTPTAERLMMPEWTRYSGMWAEIQVRTLLEHSWAAVSHKLNYKKDRPLPEGDQRDLARMMALLETVDQTFVALRRSADQFIPGMEAAGEASEAPLSEDVLSPEVV